MYIELLVVDFDHRVLIGFGLCLAIGVWYLVQKVSLNYCLICIYVNENAHTSLEPSPNKVRANLRAHIGSSVW